MIKFERGLNILQVKKVVLQIVLIIIFARIRIDSYNSLLTEKSLTFHNGIILIKSVVNKNKNYYHNIFLKKGSYKDQSNTECF